MLQNTAICANGSPVPIIEFTYALATLTLAAKLMYYRRSHMRWAAALKLICEALITHRKLI